MYPSFITLVNSDTSGTRLLKICGHEFKAFDYDWYIEDAIMLAKCWKPHQITYRRILHLRTWIRENYQHGHEIPYKHLRSLHGCKHWVESVIHKEYKYADETFKSNYEEMLTNNTLIFLRGNSS
ncbi:hypothetical protein SAMN05660461_5305 [Chitinophaga ginsengisegetis]|uniref:Uncharacterized protein n=1 Tax=Chitinophaga ginsengisegetis TaxID=393003 RepID=A0A1T5P9W5_9BACT|nr:hypothetical protein SAMN05660461_5305 [Chitinophaga ginsengisegetis]